MTRPDERRYRRLLRWYPRRWRQDHGEVLLGLLLDDAEARGRVAPSAGERLRAARDGIGSRLTGRVAVASSLLGLAAATLAGIGSIWALELLISIGAGWIVYALTTCVAPALVLLGLVSLGRERGSFTEGRALAVLALGAPALLLGALAAASLAEGFAAADDGLPPSPFADAAVLFLVAGFALGSVACTFALEAHFTRDGMGRTVAAAAAIPLGMLLAVSIAPAILMPAGSAIVAAIVAAIALAARRSPAAPGWEPAPSASAHAAARAGLSSSAFRATRWLSILSAIGSTVGVAFAFTGSLWPTTAGAIDATEAMGRGLSLALLSGVPLLAAIGVRIAARSAHAPRHTLGPLALCALWFAAVAGGYVFAPDGADLYLGFGIGAALGAGGLAWWLVPRMRGPRALRIAYAVLAGLAAAAVLGLILAPLLAFAVPIAAIVLAARRRDRPRGTDAARPEPVLAS